MIAVIVVLLLLFVVLAIQAFALYVEIRLLNELRAIAASIQELRNQRVGR